MKAPGYFTDPFRALTGAFFARFFESEITTGYDDLKSSFFWLLAALAMPGIFIPWLMVFDWHMIGIFKGADALREASQAEKVFYLGFSMIASGFLTTIVWSSLLPDRRDTLILGGLPVASSTIVAAKLAALVGYVVLIGAAMHAGGALFFGSILATNSGAFFAVRGIVAHFVAASAASASVALIVAASQGVVLALAGPRWFTRLAVVLQACLVGLMAMGLALLPIMTFSTVHTIRGFGANMRPWLLSAPPLWFLGIYEWVLGTSDPLLLGLAVKAAAALAIPILVIVATFPLAYRRLMVSVVEHGQAGRQWSGRLVRGVLIGAAGRHPEAKAAADFYLTTLARVERHRFMMAMAAGIAVAWVVLGASMMDPPSGPEAAWLSLPLSAMIFLLAGLRLAASLPGDIRGTWLFELMEPSRAHARQAIERVMFLLGVVIPAATGSVVFWWLWGTDVALVYGLTMLSIGAAIVEFMLRRYEGMPCGVRLTMGTATLGYRWPFHVAAFLVISIYVPRVELWLTGHPYLAAVFVGQWLIAASAMRHAAARHVILPSYDEVDPAAGVLRLN